MRTTTSAARYIVTKRERWTLPEEIDADFYAAGPPKNERGVMQWRRDKGAALVFTDYAKARELAKMFRAKVRRLRSLDGGGQTISGE